MPTRLPVYNLDPADGVEGDVIKVEDGRFVVGAVDTAFGRMTPYATIAATRDPANPTLEETGVDSMPENIIKVGDTYWLLYASKDGSSYYRLHLASSSSKHGPWAPYGSNPVLDVGSQAWEGFITNGGCILEHEGTFYIFYSSYGGSSDGVGVATASSVTGPYTKYASNPILEPSVSGWDSLRVQEPDVHVLDDGTWVMAFMAEDDAFPVAETEKIGIATASDPFGPWTKSADNPVLDFGDPGEWDAAVVADPSMLRDPSGFWWMQYSGTTSGGGPAGASVGLAWALDPRGTWHKWGEILGPSGGAGDFDEDGVFRGAIYYEDGEYVMPYCGVPASGFRKGGNAILTVTSDTDLHGHESAADPHAQYLTQTEGDARYVRTVNNTAPDVDGNVDVAGAGGAGEILVSDTITPPIDFSDLLTNEAQDDLIYEG
ncbi:MAG TPA: hypothetical protein VFK41_03120 [Nocardioidaceae bacterium]|nr:hypothetical protein [Nocardioidaceae bacterium]